MSNLTINRSSGSNSVSAPLYETPQAPSVGKREVEQDLSPSPRGLEPSPSHKNINHKEINQRVTADRDASGKVLKGFARLRKFFQNKFSPTFRKQKTAEYKKPKQPRPEKSSLKAGEVRNRAHGIITQYGKLATTLKKSVLLTDKQLEVRGKHMMAINSIARNYGEGERMSVQDLQKVSNHLSEISALLEVKESPEIMLQNLNQKMFR